MTLGTPITGPSWQPLTPLSGLDNPGTPLGVARIMTPGNPYSRGFLFGEGGSGGWVVCRFAPSNYQVFFEHPPNVFQIIRCFSAQIWGGWVVCRFDPPPPRHHADLKRDLWYGSVFGGGPYTREAGSTCRKSLGVIFENPKKNGGTPCFWPFCPKMGPTWDSRAIM